MARSGGPSKAQLDQWNDKAMQLFKRHDQNGDGLLDPREMASAVNELCGNHGFSTRSLSASLGLDQRMENSSYRWSPVEFQDLFRRAMLMADVGEAAGNGRNAVTEKLVSAAVDIVRDLDAKTEAQLKQCFSNYCRLAVGTSKLMMDGDLKIVKDQWMQLCCDVGVAAPIGPVAPSDLAAIYAAAAMRASGLTLKPFLTALAMISPDLTALCEHMVGQLGPQLRPRSGSDAPQPVSVGVRSLDLRGASMTQQSTWGVATGVLGAVQAFMRAGNMSGHSSAAHSPHPSQGGAVGGMLSSAPNSGCVANMAFPTSFDSNDSGRCSVGGSPASVRRQSNDLAPIIGGPITARLGGGIGGKRSSLSSMGGAMGLPTRPASINGVRTDELGPSSGVLLDRLAAAEARITQLEQQQAFAREMMAAGNGGSGATGGGGGGGGDTSGMPHMAAMAAKIAALEAELARVAPGAELPRVDAELKSAMETLSGKLEGFSKQVEKLTKRVDTAEASVKDCGTRVREVQAPLTEVTAGLAAMRSTVDQLKGGPAKQGDELLGQLVARVSAAEGTLESLGGQMRKVRREVCASPAPPLEAKEAPPPEPGTPPSSAGPPPAAVAAVGAAAGGSNGGDYMIQTLGVVQLDSEDEMRLQIKFLVEAMDNLKRRMSQLSGSHLNPVDYPTRAELSEVKKVLLDDIGDIDAKYIKLQRELQTVTLKIPLLEKKVDSSALGGGGGTDVVNRLVGMGMARIADLKDTENYLTERQGGLGKQFDSLRRDMDDVQSNLEANLEKLVTQFNNISKQMMDARREGGASSMPMMGGGGTQTSAAAAATAASAAATAAQTASDAKSAVDRERMDRERETRELRDRLSRTESHLGGAVGELQQVMGVELSTIKEVLAQLEAAMTQGDAESMRTMRELDAALRGALGAFGHKSDEQSDMTGKVIMKMARQITEIQVKLKEQLACSPKEGNSYGGAPPQLQHPAPPPGLPPAQPLRGGGSAGQQRPTSQEDVYFPGLQKETFASKMLSMTPSPPRDSDNGAGPQPVSPRAGSRTSVPGSIRSGMSMSGASGGRNPSPARGMLVADPPPAPGGRLPSRMSDAGLVGPGRASTGGNRAL